MGKGRKGCIKQFISSIRQFKRGIHQFRPNFQREIAELHVCTSPICCSVLNNQMIILNWKELIKGSLYLIAIPVLFLLIIGFQYLISANEIVNGTYEYDFMFGADAIPTPWYMKTEELFMKYCIVYGSSLILTVIGYLIALLKNKKIMQLGLGIITSLVLFYEYKMFLDSIP